MFVTFFIVYVPLFPGLSWKPDTKTQNYEQVLTTQERVREKEQEILIPKSWLNCTL